MLGLSPPTGRAATGRQEMQARNIKGNFIVWEMVDGIAAEAIRNSLFLLPFHAVTSHKGVLSLEATK